MDVESFDERSARTGEVERSEVPYRQPGPLGWITATNHNASVIAMLRRVRRALPGDPEFGDPLSAAGEGGPRAAARAKPCPVRSVSALCRSGRRSPNASRDGPRTVR